MTEHSDAAILCEACGYPLGGLSPEMNCPECGRCVAASLPSARPGSPWQMRPGLFAWVRTGWGLLRRPSATFAAIRIVPGGVGLLAINLILAGFVIADPWVGVFVGDPARGPAPAWGDLGHAARHGVVLLAETLAVALVLFGLTYVEYAGIRFISRLRGWRLTKAAAWQVCAHASVGWIASGVFALLILAGLQAAVVFFGVAPHGTVDFNAGVPGVTRIGPLIGIGGPALGYLAGLLVFEFLVHRGVRACKYAAAATGT